MKNPSAMQETWIQSLGWEDSLEEDMVTHSGILAWTVPMDRGAWQAAVYGVTESDTTERLSTAIKEGDLEEGEDRSLICVIITALGTAERLRN